MANKSLHKGLDKLFGIDTQSLLEEIQQGNDPNYQDAINQIAINTIRANPYQPRKEFDAQALAELAQSIKVHGVLTPILVRKSLNGFEVIAGERRLRASKLAELETIPAIIVDFDDTQMMEVALIENIQREDLNPIEEAQGYKLLSERLGYSQQQIAERVNKSRSHITNMLRILDLPAEILTLVEKNQLSMGHVRPLVPLENDKQKVQLAQLFVERAFSVRQAEAYVDHLKKDKTPAKVEKKNNYQYPVRLLEDKLGTKVNISKHKITIHFTNMSDLNRILEILDVIEDV